MVFHTLKWIGGIDGYLELIDQRKLPGEFIKIQCRNVEELFGAIQTLAVRGAPAIGVAAGYGLCLAMQEIKISTNTNEVILHLRKSAGYLAKSRPTAVNLSWALERIKKCADNLVIENKNIAPAELREAIFNEADNIYREDVDMCKKIGMNGKQLIQAGDGVLTHCNAGALATAGEGTALAVIFEAHKAGKKFKVYVDETRPLLQGARLSCWELKQAGIDATLICDNMAGWLMKQGKINAVITGADRIAANGDAANKIGTFSLSILAKEHNIPFYIAAPSSTFDLHIENGGQIPIEQRSAEEVRSPGGVEIAPSDVDVYNPAFDVTEARNITAIITEKGVIEKPDRNTISEHLRQ